MLTSALPHTCCWTGLHSSAGQVQPDLTWPETPLGLLSFQFGSAAEPLQPPFLWWRELVSSVVSGSSTTARQDRSRQYTAPVFFLLIDFVLQGSTAASLLLLRPRCDATLPVRRRWARRPRPFVLSFFWNEQNEKLLLLVWKSSDFSDLLSSSIKQQRPSLFFLEPIGGCYNMVRSGTLFVDRTCLFRQWPISDLRCKSRSSADGLLYTNLSLLVPPNLSARQGQLQTIQTPKTTILNEAFVIF